MSIDPINQYFAGLFFALFLASAYCWLRDRDEYFALLCAVGYALLSAIWMFIL